MRIVRISSRDAWAAHQRRPGQPAASVPRLPRLATEAERADLAEALHLTAEAGLSPGEGTALVESLRTLGTLPKESSIDPYLEGLNLTPDQRETMEERLSDKVAPSTAETVNKLLVCYGSAERRYHMAPSSTRGTWEFFSDLVPGLASPLKSIPTQVADLATVKLITKLTSLSGETVDGFAGTHWTRAIGGFQEGAGASLRALVEDAARSADHRRKARRRIKLEKANQPKKSTPNTPETGVTRWDS